MPVDGLAMACLRAAPPTTNDVVNGAARDAALVAQGQEIAVANTIGMSLRQVYRGRKLSKLALEVDTLRFQSFMEKLQGRRVGGEGVHSAEPSAASALPAAAAALYSAPWTPSLSTRCPCTSSTNN